jgi:predicted metalloprotease
VWSRGPRVAVAASLVHSVEVKAGRWISGAGVAVVLLAACAVEPGVATQSADHLETPITTSTTAPDSGPDPTTVDPTDPSAPPATPSHPTRPTRPTDPTSPPTTAQVGDLGAQLDFGDAKTPRDYDDFLAAALTDIEAWWTEQFPAVYGKPFEPITGRVYAGYPERTSEIPGCESRQPTTYEEIAQFSAFYCQQGDFMVYDDGPDGLLAQLTSSLGSSILGVVFAHEFGHAVQSRAGVLDHELPTIVTEQQADCFAGAWVAHAASGEGGVTFSDSDVRSGLVAMIQVRDPRGVDQFTQGGHGSAFDRVGAFQTGFTEGVARCAQLIDDPLPLVPNIFQTRNSDGDAPFGYGKEQIVGFITSDLNEYWSTALSGVTVPALTVVPVQSADEVACDEPAGSFASGAVLCPATNEVFMDEPLARDLDDRFGDFVVGYILGGAWSEAAQLALGSTLQGEQRHLIDDCMTGGWAQSIVPDADGTTPRKGAVIEPGDLDEAIQTALVLSDEASTDDVLGTGFEQIASFRQGVLNGLEACTSQIGG